MYGLSGAVCRQSYEILFSAKQDVRSFMLFLSIALGCINLAGIVFLRSIPPSEPAAQRKRRRKKTTDGEEEFLRNSDTDSGEDDPHNDDQAIEMRNLNEDSDTDNSLANNGKHLVKSEDYV